MLNPPGAYEGRSCAGPQRRAPESRLTRAYRQINIDGARASRAIAALPRHLPQAREGRGQAGRGGGEESPNSRGQCAR